MSIDKKKDKYLLVKGILREVKGGKDFAAAAKEYSEDISASEGGDVGVVEKGKMVPEFENAVYSYNLLSPKPNERWVLVTSAYHMPRSMGSFRKAGWMPIPYPVDYVTRGPDQLSIGFNMVARFSSFGRGLRAWSGLVVYRVLGRMDALFPAPFNDSLTKK